MSLVGSRLLDLRGGARGLVVGMNGQETSADARGSASALAGAKGGAAGPDDALSGRWGGFVNFGYAWGDVWAREGLDRRTRSCITLAALTALRAEGEIALHVRAALRNGLSREEIGEVLLHTAVYAGVPAANSAFAIAQAVFDEDSAPRAGGS